MGVDDSRGLLSRAIKDLNSAWLETRASWDDAVAIEFEEVNLAPLQLDVKSAMSAIDQASKLLHQVRRDCM
jgi:hypothetical protein